VEITLEHLQAKRQEYEAGYMEHIALANANHGAMEAIHELIARLSQPKEADSVEETTE